MRSDIVDYSEFKLCSIQAETHCDVPFAEDNSFYRVEIPFSPDNTFEMLRKGFVFADRTMGVSVLLKKNEIDYRKLVRFKVRKKTDDDDDAILEIALSSFPYDRRFHIRPMPDDKVADVIINTWVRGLSDTYVCIHKDQVIGFLDIEPCDETGQFIHLAAIRERYRAAGAAVSLYAHVINELRESGWEKVYGRISSANSAVMNLYARLGGFFSDPVDVFVRDEHELGNFV